MGFSGGSVVKNPLANEGHAGDMGSIHGLGRSLGGGHGDLLQYFCWENSFGRGAWWATVLRSVKSLDMSEQLSTREVIYADMQLLFSQ